MIMHHMHNNFCHVLKLYEIASREVIASSSLALRQYTSTGTIYLGC